MAEEKTVLIVGGVLVVGAIAFLMIRNSERQRLAALNQPGLMYQSQTDYAVDSGLSEIIGSASHGISNLFQSWGRDSTGSNDPGLVGPSEPYDFTAGDEYSPENANPYNPDYGAISNGYAAADDEG